jgi:hypothetical protein
MGLLSNIFRKKEQEDKTGGMQDFMTLVRVYFQATLAAQLGITNLAMLPDLRMFKTTLHVTDTKQQTRCRREGSL